MKHKSRRAEPRQKRRHAGACRAGALALAVGLLGTTPAAALLCSTANPTVVPGGTIVYDSSVIVDVPPLAADVKAFGVPLTKIAAELGRPVVKNVVAIGALQAATGLFPEETFLTAIRQALKSKCAMIPLNEEAFARGAEAVRNSES